MSPEEAVIARLRTLGGVTAIVATRIYQLKLPQSPTYPAVRVEHISEVSDPHLRGATGMKRTRIQVDALASESAGGDPLSTANTLAEAIEGNGGGSGGASVSGLSGWRGTIGTLFIAGIVKASSGQDYDPAELRAVRVRQDFFVWWRPNTA